MTKEELVYIDNLLLELERYDELNRTLKDSKLVLNKEGKEINLPEEFNSRYLALLESDVSNRIAEINKIISRFTGTYVGDIS